MTKHNRFKKECRKIKAKFSEFLLKTVLDNENIADDEVVLIYEEMIKQLENDIDIMASTCGVAKLDD